MDPPGRGTGDWTLAGLAADLSGRSVLSGLAAGLRRGRFGLRFVAGLALLAFELALALLVLLLLFGDIPLPPFVLIIWLCQCAASWACVTTGHPGQAFYI